MSIAPPSSIPLRIAVIGGGLAGLAAAHRLNELARERGTNLAITLFESGPRLGGVIGTERIGGYLIDTGADSFLTNKPAAVNLCRRLGIEDRLIPTSERHRGALVLFNGRPSPVPEGFQLMSPTAIWPMLVSPILSPWGKLRMAMELFVPPRQHSDPSTLPTPHSALRNPHLSDESLASFVRRRFGREALERLVQPLVGGIYTSDPEKLSLAATMPRFLEMERDHGSLLRATLWQGRGTRDNGQRVEAASDPKSSGARYGLFAGLAGGMEDLLSALRSRVEAACEVRLNAPVTQILSERASRSPSTSPSSQNPEFSTQYSVLGTRYSDYESESLADKAHESKAPLTLARSPAVFVSEKTGGGEETGREASQQLAGTEQVSYRIDLADGSTHPCDAVIVTTASYRAATLLGELDCELATLLGEIEYASSALVITGHRLSDVAHPLNAFGLVVPQRERRKILAVSFSNRKFPDRAPDGSVLLRTFVGGALQPELFNLSDTELISLVQAELADLFGVRGEPELAKVYRYPRAMPQYHVGHLDRVARIEALTARHPGLALTGNAYRGVGVPDVIQQAESAAERLLGIKHSE